MAAPLVDYPSSDSDAGPDPDPPRSAPRARDKQQTNDAVARPPPPLPAAFHALYPTAARPSTSDDPALHEGRTRQLPHTPGVWPTHVYIECELPETCPSVGKC
jgi:U6 snRNA phosphodiesterase